MVDHRHFIPAPKPFIFLVTRPSQGFHVVAGAIKEMDAFALFGFCVQPDQLAGIPRIFIGRNAFDNFAFGAAVGFSLDLYVSEFSKVLGCYVFIRK